MIRSIVRGSVTLWNMIRMPKWRAISIIDATCTVSDNGEIPGSPSCEATLPSLITPLSKRLLSTARYRRALFAIFRYWAIRLILL